MTTFVPHFTTFYMKEAPQLVDTIVEALQEKKGKDILIADIRQLETAVCGAMIICSAGSPAQMNALAQEVGEATIEKNGVKPMAAHGMHYAHWIAVDYGEVIVHIFLPEERAFYDLEHLWADAEITRIPNLDD